MKEINNLVYTLEINYINKSNLNTSISIQIHDDGLKIKSVKIGDVCITEETINGRILSARFDNTDGYCGYKYDYQNGENLLNLNPNKSLNNTISLINKTKMNSDFLSSEYVLASIFRNDYRVVTLNKGHLNVIKTVSAKNEKSENCSLQETINLLKLDGEESFTEQDKKRIYKIDDKCLIEEDQTLVNSCIKSQLNELSTIMSQAPRNHKDLIALKKKLQLTDSNFSVDNIINNEE